VETNIPLLRAIAAHPLFAAGNTTTDFLERTQLAEVHTPGALTPPEVLVAAALADTLTQPRATGAGVHDPWASGAWRLLSERALRLASGGREWPVALVYERDHWRATFENTVLFARVVTSDINHLALQIGAQGADQLQLQHFWMARDGAAQLIAWRGASYRVERAAALSVDQLGGQIGVRAGHASLQAPMPGTVIKVLVEEGQQVHAQQALVILEAMKMEHIVAAPYGGIVQRLACAPGALVSKGATLVELQAEQA
jgi:3-methylcrotonyl-CoA carboxylase alpha subunit